MDRSEHMELPTIGIVTISYNQAAFLDEAIQSVRISRGGLRYVVVDPGSSDGSRAIIAKYRHMISEAILERDRGPADGLNKGFAACDADVYGFLNADDRFAPGALDYVAEYFSHHSNVDVLVGAIRLMDSEGRLRRISAVPSDFTPQGFLLGTALVLQQATFFRRRAWQIVGGFNPDNRTCWDAELFLEMALAGCEFSRSDTVLGYFRLHPGGITGSNKLALQTRADLQRLRQRLVSAGYRPPSRFGAIIRKLLFRFNPIRRVRQLLAREP